MKKIIALVVISVLLASCDSLLRRSYKINPPPPEIYFPDGTELEMATAIYEGSYIRVYLLIKEGIDLNHVSKGGMTYLFYALLNTDYNMVKLLLENGADPNIHSVFYTHPKLHKKGYSDDESEGVCLEYSAYKAYHIRYMKLFVKYGANVNDTTYISPLWTAVRDEIQGKEKIKYLVEQGIDLNCGNNPTPVICGRAFMYEWDIVLFLLDVGADPMASADPADNVASSLQRYYDEGFDLNAEHGRMAQEIKRRLEKRGVKFPYRIKKKSIEPESTEQSGE